MGKLYELMKKELDTIKEVADLEKTNLIVSNSFPNINRKFKSMQKVNFLVSEINENPLKYFNSKEEYDKFVLDNNKYFYKRPIDEGTNLKAIPTIRIDLITHRTHERSDFEKIFDDLEEKIGNEKIDQLIDYYEKNSNNVYKTRNNPLEPYINTIKQDINTLYTNLNDEAKNELIADLDYANKMLVEKKYTGAYEGLLEDASIARSYTAKNYIADFAQKNNIDSEKLVSMADDINIINITCKTKEEVSMTKDAVFNNPDYKVTKEFKDKLLELDNFITELGVPSTFINGEQGTKEYGLIDYFRKTREISQLVGEYQEATTPDEKKANIEALALKSKELKELEEKYDRLFKKISETFDLDKSSINGNLYNGRGVSFIPENLKTFQANLPEKWDNENAVWGVVLSGFCQLKGAALHSGVSLSEYIDKPVESYLNTTFKESEHYFREAYIPREGNSLGTRMAHALVMDTNIGTELIRNTSIGNRGIEFLNNTEEFNNKTIDKLIASNIGVNYITKFDHSANFMWLDDEGMPNYDNLKNIFANGDKTDKLYELSDNFYTAKMEVGALYSYRDGIVSDKGLVAKNNSILENIKDYYREKVRMFDDPNSFVQIGKGALRSYVDEDALLIAGKKYLEDFMLANNKNIFDLNKNERKQVLNFIKNPAATFTSKYKKTLHLSNQNVSGIKADYKAENDRVNGRNAERFIQAFNRYNTFQGNSGKEINQVLKDNAGGWLEWLGGTTSKEYQALRDIVSGIIDPESPTYGDYKISKYFAQKYIDHKLPEGTKFEDLKPNEKRRVEFCRSIITAVNEMEEPEINLENQNDNNIIENNNIIDENDFHKKLNNDIDKENVEVEEINTDSNNNENIIDTSSKQNIEENEI